RADGRPGGGPGLPAAPVVAPPIGHGPRHPARRGHTDLPGRGMVSGADVLVDLAPGAALVLDGAEWVVERAEPQHGRAGLVSIGGQRLPVPFRFLINPPDCRPSTRTSAARAADRGRQPASVADLTARQRELVTLRVAHLLEVETGFRGGD